MPRDVTHISSPLLRHGGHSLLGKPKTTPNIWRLLLLAVISRISGEKKRELKKKIAPGKSGGVYPSRHHFVRHHRLLWSKVQRVAPFFLRAKTASRETFHFRLQCRARAQSEKGRGNNGFPGKKRSVNNGPSFSLRYSKPQ